MPLFFIITALVILCLPITVSSRSLAEAEGNYILQNIALRPFPSFALKFELDGGGVVITRNNKSRRLSSKKNNKKKEEKAKKKTFPFELGDLKPVRIKELSIRGSFGGDDAMQTALFCAGAVTAAHLAYRFLPKAEKFRADILPDYTKPGLQVAISLNFQLNLLMIFFILASILLRKIKGQGN